MLKSCTNTSITFSNFFPTLVHGNCRIIRRFLSLIGWPSIEPLLSDSVCTHSLDISVCPVVYPRFVSPSRPNFLTDRNTAKPYKRYLPDKDPLMCTYDFRTNRFDRNNAILVHCLETPVQQTFLPRTLKK